jgi:hypothetical protein
MAARTWKRAALIGLLLVVGGCGAQLFLYWRTDAVYEELVAAYPQTRAEVEDRLGGFRAARVSEREAMQPILREELGSQREYWRYTRYPGFSIDVVYEPDGSVFSLWPEYE